MVNELALPGPGHTQCPSAFLSRPTLSGSPHSTPRNPPFPSTLPTRCWGDWRAPHQPISLSREMRVVPGPGDKATSFVGWPPGREGEKTLGEVPRSRDYCFQGSAQCRRPKAAARFPEKPLALPPFQESAAGPPSCCPSLLYCR